MIQSKTQHKKATKDPLSAMVSASEPTGETPPVKLPQHSPTKRRRPRSNGGAVARALFIWNALQQWNQQHPDNTFALNPALLEVTFHIHRQAAHDFIDEYRAQIDVHHAAITVKTVRTHNRGKDISPLKASVEQCYK